MATLIKIKYSNQADHLPSVMRSVIAYCLQPEKTRSAEEAWSVSGINCDPEMAYQEFMAKKLYGKRPTGCASDITFNPSTRTRTSIPKK